MRLREIKPGMVIHCKNDEEKKALLEEAEILGYLWANGVKPTKELFPSNTLVFREYGLKKYICWAGYSENHTEFSDLILPELTAYEVLNTCHKICEEKSCNQCPMRNNCFTCKDSDARKIIEICEHWKSDHEKKEPEIETVDICRIIEIMPDGKKRCVHEEDLASGSTDAEINILVEAALRRYCMEHKGEFIAVHEVVSRVKKV